MNPIDHSLEGTTQRMEERRAAMVAILPSELKDREDVLPARIRAGNASVQSKLGRIYALVDEFSAHRAPYIACRQGCSDCCRMNVQISNQEAARIAAATGRRARPLTREVQHADDKFAGKACPFLMDSSCSIYEHRPMSVATIRHSMPMPIDAIRNACKR
ncbi:YkgJ family cysteine cluster protein [Variovorax paradoxus]|uniref:YkgJ family cysteine cluster protein n=1 Tax=Variovorax paradoxus TaxID=34073 RepID=UPI00069A4368|nr:YkgJ family cysteine cluster protein [Variovorax paradoxus]